MLLAEIMDRLEAKPSPGLDAERAAAVDIEGGYASDLLSDVMAHAKTGQILITIQAHRNTVAVASLVGCPAILVCNGRPLPDDMLEAAREEGIVVLVTPLDQYRASGRLYAALGS